MQAGKKIVIGIIIIAVAAFIVIRSNKAPVETPVVVQTPQYSTYTDKMHTFSFSYPSTYEVTNMSTDSWRANTQSPGALLARTIIPKSFEPNTNFSEATFTVGMSDDAAAIKDCLVATNGEYAKEITTINGIEYKQFTLGDAGAGNRYDTKSYRTIHEGKCYAVEYTIHSTNIGNYSPEQGIQEFDVQAVVAALEQIAQSFTFITLVQ